MLKNYFFFEYLFEKYILQASIALDGWFYAIDRNFYAQTNQPILMLNASKWQWAKNLRRMKKFNSEKNDKIIFTLK